MQDAPLSKGFKLGAVTVTRCKGDTLSIDVVIKVSGTQARYGLPRAYYTLKCSKYIRSILSGSVSPILSGFLGDVVGDYIYKPRIFTKGMRRFLLLNPRVKLSPFVRLLQLDMFAKGKVFKLCFRATLFLDGILLGL